MMPLYPFESLLLPLRSFRERSILISLQKF
jgi:hypothetical protein